MSARWRLSVLGLVHLAVCCLAGRQVSAFRQRSDVVDNANHSRRGGSPALIVRVHMASLRLPAGRKHPQPKVQARVASRKIPLDTDPNFPAENIVFTIPLEPRDGSLMLDLFDGRRKLGGVKKTLRNGITNEPNQWHRFNENLKGGNGVMNFKVCYDDGHEGCPLPDVVQNDVDALEKDPPLGARPKLGSSAGGLPPALLDRVLGSLHGFVQHHAEAEDYSPQVKQHDMAHTVTGPTYFDVCLALHATASEATKTPPWCLSGKEELSIYFACYGGDVDIMEVCYFKTDAIEIQMCRSSMGRLSLKNTGVGENGAFTIPLEDPVTHGQVYSSISGNLLNDGSFEDSSLTFDNHGELTAYTSRCEAEDALVSHMESHVAPVPVLEDCSSCFDISSDNHVLDHHDTLCNSCRVYRGDKKHTALTWTSTCEACSEAMTKAQEVGDLIDNHKHDELSLFF